MQSPISDDRSDSVARGEKPRAHSSCPDATKERKSNGRDRSKRVGRCWIYEAIFGKRSVNLRTIRGDKFTEIAVIDLSYGIAVTEGAKAGTRPTDLVN